MQWENLTAIKWTEKLDTIAFWSEVAAYRDAAGNNPFCDLTDFVFRLLVLPLSNAEIERVFSQMNLVKTKVRNRTQSLMLNSILTVRAGLKRQDCCCHDLPIPIEIIENIGKQIIYSQDGGNANEVDDLD